MSFILRRKALEFMRFEIETARPFRIQSLVVCLGMLVGIGCRPSADSPAALPSRDASSSAPGEAATNLEPSISTLLLRDITERSHLKFQHQAGGDPFFVPRSIGSGAAMMDVDGDGRLDLYLIQNAGPGSTAKNCLLRQTSDLQFEDISDGSGLDLSGWGMGCAAGDVNNDGRVDLLVTEYGGIHLFLNETLNGAVRFREVTVESQLDNPAWATSASFLDYNVDGALDLVVVNYLDYDSSRTCTDAGGRPDFCGPQVFAPVVARLFRQVAPNSDSQTTDPSTPVFEDVTLEAGLGGKPAAGLGVVCADLTGDGRIDIFTANDGMPNHLWVQRPDRSFSEEAASRGLAYNAIGQAQANMGVAWGDVNGDGWFDLFVTHRTTETHTLWSQQSDGLFSDLTAGSGIARTSWRGEGFGTTLADLDLDSDLDMALVNGLVLRAVGDNLESNGTEVTAFWRPYAQRNQILLNDGKGKFLDASEENRDFSGQARVSRGLTCGDLNNDGRLELLVTCIAGPARLYQATCPEDRHWLIVRAIDPRWRRDAYGARVVLSVGKLTQQRDIHAGYSFLASNDPRAHFGLAQANRYTRLRVLWPDGLDETFEGGIADRVVTLERGTGQKSVADQDGAHGL